MSDIEWARIEALLKEATAEAAAALAVLEQQTASRELRKAARRALYLLSTRGIRARPDEISGEALPDVPATEMLRAYATGFDGAGNRILFFEIAESNGGKPTAVQMMFNDLTGLQTCDTARLARRDLQLRIQQMEEMQTEGLAFVEITADYGRWLLQEARELLRRQHRPSPTGVLALLPRIGVARRDYPVSPIYEAVSIESLHSDDSIDRNPAALFARKWFENWFFTVEDVLRALADWENAADTSDVSASDRAAEQRELIVREVATDLFTPAVRLRYVRRLEETADILWRLSHRTEARMALIHAQGLAADGPVADVPFACALVERTLVAGVAMLNEKRAERARQG